MFNPLLVQLALQQEAQQQVQRIPTNGLDQQQYLQWIASSPWLQLQLQQQALAMAQQAQVQLHSFATRS